MRHFQSFVQTALCPILAAGGLVWMLLAGAACGHNDALLQNLAPDNANGNLPSLAEAANARLIAEYRTVWQGTAGPYYCDDNIRLCTPGRNERLTADGNLNSAFVCFAEGPFNYPPLEPQSCVASAPEVSKIGSDALLTLKRSLLAQDLSTLSGSWDCQSPGVTCPADWETWQLVFDINGHPVTITYPTGTVRFLPAPIQATVQAFADVNSQMATK